MQSSISNALDSSGINSGIATGNEANRASQAKAVVSHRGDDQLSTAEIGLLFAAFSTLLCSVMLNVIVP